MKKLLVRGGLVVSDGKQVNCDILIEGEKITAIGRSLSYPDAQIIDATGKLVFPGMIDSHVHIGHPNKRGSARDSFYTATRSAALGGVSTIIDFAIQWDKEKSLLETWKEKVQLMSRECVTDFALHNCPTVSEPKTIEEMDALIEEGSPSFKFYMTYSSQNRMTNDGVLYEALRKSAGTQMRIGVHAENDALINYLSEQYRQRGETDSSYFAEAKPAIVENEAVHRALYFARETRGNLFLFHLTTAEGVRLVKDAKRDGVPVVAETCTHYLVLDEEYLKREDGYAYICSPPLRRKSDQEALWAALRDGSVSIVSSDHCGFDKALKREYKGDFTKIPNGLPGIDHRLRLIYTHGVRKGKISLETMVDVLSTNIAKTFGMYPRKGTISVGSDADLVIYNPNGEEIIERGIDSDSIDWTPYKGFLLEGSVDMTISRGEVLVQDGEFSGEPGRGCLILRDILQKRQK